MNISEKLVKCICFIWDKANAGKNWIKHNVSPSECEQMFFNIPLIAADDIKHSRKEKRYYALGKTDKNRMLFIVFTIRKNHIRVISVRDMHKKERQVYNNYEKNS